MQVREVMSRDVLVTSPDDTIEKAAILMGKVNCGALPVGENDRLVGMVTDRDITLRAVAKGNPPIGVRCAKSCRTTSSMSLKTRLPKQRPKA
jgi:CBS domain-containing protein